MSVFASSRGLSRSLASGLIACVVALLFVQVSNAQPSDSPLLDKSEILKRFDFWDNQDWNWYKENIPFFECPDDDITLTYYYRWELITKHLTYGSPNTGYLFTEFIDRPFWSGAYGAISCPAGHQLYEARWLRSPRVAQDYSRYWLRTPGAQPRNYSTWLADSVWEVNRTHPNREFTIDLLNDLIANYEGWEKRHFVKEVGLFWQTGHDDGMEFNINSRQTQDILRGAPSYRPSFNAYMWADAVAIAKIAELAGKSEIASQYRVKARNLKDKMIELMWDEQRQFFFPVFKNDEERDGHINKALTKTYESGQHAGSPFGRELIGYVPWHFDMIDDERFDIAWKKLMDREAFYADYGPSTVERNDPMFLLQRSCCWWSGQSWPFATTQTLKAMANLIQRGTQVINASDYVDMLGIYARSHRKDGRPYLAEALHPDTGSFEGHDGYNHSEHYFHSAYCDLVITGLVGFRTRDDDALELIPLAPPEWDYFALDDLRYRDSDVSILWDRTGERYGRGKGLKVYVDGKLIAESAELQPLKAVNVFTKGTNSTDRSTSISTTNLVNFAVNNDGTYYPRLTTSYTSGEAPLMKVNDGNYWYAKHPPNRWTAEGSSNPSDWIEIDFGIPRPIETLQLYFLDDGDNGRIVPPDSVEIEVFQNGEWTKLFDASKPIQNVVGRRPTTISLGGSPTDKVKITMKHSPRGKSGLTEIEAWGPATLPVKTAPPPAGNHAYNDGSSEFPRATASHFDRFGGVPKSAIDGKVVFTPTPTNRWTSYESPNAQDWLQVEFGETRRIGRAELYIYDDRGGVQTPTEYWVEYWADSEWKRVANETHEPSKPTGSVMNTSRFQPVETTKIRVVFVNKGQARSGVTELELWSE
ncbi:MGH1-like glycoside hydrolase domain-containing protein [Pirellulaceae bacterium SH449]